MRTSYILLLVLSLLSVSCASKKGVYPREKVEYLSDSSNAVMVRATAYGKNSEEAITNAELASVKTLLFRGIPGSNKVESILVGVNEQEIQKTHSAYFDGLFNSHRYRSFIISSVPVTGFSKDATGNKSITTDVKINVKALRMDLEQNGVIRKFGY